MRKALLYTVRADLHIHTVLSPCGDIEMTPLNIVAKAKKRGLSVIGITDHNSTRETAEVKRVAEREGLFVLCGAEITTKEEVHVLAYVDGQERLSLLQDFLDTYLIKVKNNEAIFGYQLVVNEKEEVLYQEDNLLIGAIDRSIDEVAAFIKSLDGIFIPAHIDKQQNSLLSQLGFLPFSLNPDALELSAICNTESFFKQNSYLETHPFICSSDAHYLEDIGRASTELNISELSFQSVKSALKSANKNSFVYE